MYGPGANDLDGKGLGFPFAALIPLVQPLVGAVAGKISGGGGPSEEEQRAALLAQETERREKEKFQKVLLISGGILLVFVMVAKS